MNESNLTQTDPHEQEPIFELSLPEGRITLLGTAHVSQASADTVRELTASGGYDAVAIELCPSRYNALIDPDSLARLDLFRVIRDGKASMVCASLALGAFQQRMADELGVEPGAEMRAASDSARDAGLPVLLIDRDVGTTLKRVYRNVPWWQRMELITGLLASVVVHNEVSREEIENLKQSDMLEATFAQFAEQSERIYTPLVGERDQYMAQRLMQELANNDYKHILAVVGAGHLKGIKRYLTTNLEGAQSVAELERLPPRRRWPRLIPWVIVALVLTGFVIGFQRSPDLGLKLVAEWVVINGGLSALGALIATAHPLTVLTAFLAAPLTSLNPTVGAGMVTGAMEAWLRKPRVGDFSQLKHDTARLSGWWKNRVARTLLVFLFSTLGSAAGTYIAGFRIFDQLTP